MKAHSRANQIRVCVEEPSPKEITVYLDGVPCCECGRPEAAFRFHEDERSLVCRLSCACGLFFQRTATGPEQKVYFGSHIGLEKAVCISQTHAPHLTESFEPKRLFFFMKGGI